MLQGSKLVDTCAHAGSESAQAGLFRRGVHSKERDATPSSKTTASGDRRTCSTVCKLERRVKPVTDAHLARVPSERVRVQRRYHSHTPNPTMTNTTVPAPENTAGTASTIASAISVMRDALPRDNCHRQNRQSLHTRHTHSLSLSLKRAWCAPRTTVESSKVPVTLGPLDPRNPSQAEQTVPQVRVPPSDGHLQMGNTIHSQQPHTRVWSEGHT